MKKLIELIQNNQPFLLKKTLYYAKTHDYTKYTSTLEEAWIASVSGLSHALVLSLQEGKKIPEINVDHDFMHDPISSFGILEAKKHRQRGITLEMFLGLMKYYRQSYVDLILEWVSDQKKQQLYILWVNRFFDRNEIAFCMESNSQSKETLLSELQKTNRELTNEKNKYLTIFESIPTPVLLFDTDNYSDNMNYAAQQFLQKNIYSPGYIYYTDNQKRTIENIVPCIHEEFSAFCQGSSDEITIEKICESPSQGQKNIMIKFHRMLDVSGKFSGTVVIFTDLTERKQIEERLRYISFHDTLTGLYNRSHYEQEISRLSTQKGNFIGVISCDIDGLKVVNDNLGHHAGDSLIKIVGNILKSSFKENDIVCRVGGDEFITIMPYTDDKAVNAACSKIRQKIEQHNTLHKKNPISVSVGGASRKVFAPDDILKVIKEADNLLYAEKRTNHEAYHALFLQHFENYGQELFNEDAYASNPLKTKGQKTDR